jgi:hypothetical protein
VARLVKGLVRALSESAGSTRLAGLCVEHGSGRFPLTPHTNDAVESSARDACLYWLPRHGPIETGIAVLSIDCLDGW